MTLIEMEKWLLHHDSLRFPGQSAVAIKIIQALRAGQAMKDGYNALIQQGIDGHWINTHHHSQLVHNWENSVKGVTND